MNARPRDDNVTPDSETARLFREAVASPEPTRVDSGERVYRGAADAEIPARLPSPTPEEVAASIEGIKQSAGGWVGLVDAEELKAYIWKRRKSANRPSIKR